MHCKRLLKYLCYCTYKAVCSFSKSSRLDIFQSLWLSWSNTTTRLHIRCSDIYTLQSLAPILALLACYVFWPLRQLYLSVNLFSSFLCRFWVCSEYSFRDGWFHTSFLQSSSPLTFFSIPFHSSVLALFTNCL